jgi:sulfur transfer protein SufE
MSGTAKLTEILKDIATYEDRDMRADLLIDLADRFVDVPPSIAKRPFSDLHRVPGCESEVYIWASDNQDGTVKYYFAVENPHGISARALAVLLDEGLSNQPLTQVSLVSAEIVPLIFGGAISMGKGTGLSAMVRMVRDLAVERLKGRNIQ